MRCSQYSGEFEGEMRFLLRETSTRVFRRSVESLGWYGTLLWSTALMLRVKQLGLMWTQWLSLLGGLCTRRRLMNKNQYSNGLLSRFLCLYWSEIPDVSALRTRPLTRTPIKTNGTHIFVLAIANWTDGILGVDVSNWLQLNDVSSDMFWRRLIRWCPSPSLLLSILVNSKRMNNEILCKWWLRESAKRKNFIWWKRRVLVLVVHGKHKIRLTSYTWCICNTLFMLFSWQSAFGGRS